MFFTFRLNLKRTVAVLSLVAVLLLLPYFINATKRTAATATPKKVACLTFDDGPRSISPLSARRIAQATKSRSTPTPTSFQKSMPAVRAFGRI